MSNRRIDSAFVRFLCLQLAPQSGRLLGRREDEFAREATKLLDRGAMITIDYGADFEALAWLQVVKPNYEGVHIIWRNRIVPPGQHSEGSRIRFVLMTGGGGTRFAGISRSAGDF